MIHLEGNNAPVAEERDAVPTRVVGTIPGDLHGTFFRNGPNPRSGWSPHMFLGDGMVHAVELPRGAYRNRYVHTPLFDEPTLPRNRPQITTANTHVIAIAEHLLALEEGGYPYELTRGLETLGPFTFDGALRGPMTAHPKRCPRTGEWLFFGYSIRPPFLTYYRWDGAQLRSQPIELACCSMMHDFAITETRVVFFDSPWIFDGSPWRWDAERGARIGIMPRAGGDVSWMGVETAHLSHAANAFDDGAAVVLTGTRIAGPEALPVMHEWRVGPAGVTERPLDEHATEYPRVADAVVGLHNEFTYSAGFFFTAEPDHGEINKHTGDSKTTRALPTGHTCGEAVFVARANARGEDDGYLLTFAHDRETNTSYLLILDAATLETAAEVHFPIRIPGGFHGTWVPGASLG